MIADFAVVKRCPRFASMAYARSLQRCTTRAATFEAGFAIRHQHGLWCNICTSAAAHDSSSTLYERSNAQLLQLFKMPGLAFFWLLLVSHCR